MKKLYSKNKINHFLFSSVVLLFFTVVFHSCTSEQMSESAPATTTDWKAKIEQLNAQYAQKAAMNLSKRKVIRRANSGTATPSGTSDGSEVGGDVPMGGTNDGFTNDEVIDGEEIGNNTTNGQTYGPNARQRHDASIGIGAIAGGLAIYLLAASNVPVIVAGAVGIAIGSLVGITFEIIVENTTEEEQEILSNIEEAQKEKEDKLEPQKTELINFKDLEKTVFYDDNPWDDDVWSIFGPRKDDPDYIEKIFQGITTNKIEYCDPINGWYDIEPAFNNAIGVEVGPKINFVITQMMENPRYTQMETSDAIYSIMGDYQLASVEEMDQLNHLFYGTDFLNLIESNKQEAYNISNDLENRFNELLREFDLDAYFDISCNLDMPTQREYADAYTRLVEEAYNCSYISEEEAILINASISSAYYQNMLWRPVVETPYTTDVRMAFDVEKDRVIYCNEEGLQVLLASGEATFWGVPHFVRNYLTEVYFYGNARDNYSLPDIHELTISDKTEYVFGGNASDIEYNCYHRLMPGTYPVSHLEQFGARFIKAYDYNY